MSRAGQWLGLLSQPGGFVFSQTISADTSDYNLRTAAAAAGWDQTLPLIAQVTINSGVVVSSTSPGLYGFDTGATAYPATSRLSLSMQGAYIVGRGGSGGNGADINNIGITSGGTGGSALRVTTGLATTIDALSGFVVAGGGGGGGGRGASTGGQGATRSAGGGGGGGRSGRTNSPGGAAGTGASFSGPAAAGAPGTFTSAGTGGGGGDGVPGGAGGNGGTWGAAGGAGGSTGLGAGAGGGAGGAAVVGNSNITWINTGTRLGSIT